ncbi:MAG: O-acetylhomoserine aminocarboxypropyltransferase/cysteine synthase [Acetobacterium woodii]|nr:O-acetylhomoserine aminocarboxypropyltransferase/cysteine synthase [Acetobacterium woodii]
MANENYKFDTLKVRGGYKPEDHNYSVAVPIYQTAAYDLGSPDRADNLFLGNEEGFLYTRVNNPTVDVLEKRVAALDGAVAGIALAAGMAAIAYTILNIAEGGGRILSSAYIYGAASDSFKKIYPKFGIYFDLSRNFENLIELEKEIKPDTKAIYVESISNPNGALVDIEALAELAHKHGIPLVVDNTFATPYLFNPIKHGADIVVYSATKALNGHGNVIAGLVLESGNFNWDSEKFPQFQEKHYTLRDEQDKPRSFAEKFPDFPFTTRIRLNYLNYLGASISPFDAYLILLGIETLSERIQKQVSNTIKVIEYLEKNEHVEWIKYPSLKTSPYYELSEKYFPRGTGSVLSFGFLGSLEKIKEFIETVNIFSYHANVGDARSLIINSPRTTHSELTPDEQNYAKIEPNLIRLSIGLEDPDDLIADLDQAFKQVFKEA